MKQSKTDQQAAVHNKIRAFARGAATLMPVAIPFCLGICVLSLAEPSSGGEVVAHTAIRPNRPIRATVVGQTRLWTIDRPVAETERDEIFQTERYGPAFSYRFSDVPHGPCTVRLGFNENKWTRRGERVFDISINGQLVWPSFDILAHGMTNEAVMVSASVLVPKSGDLEIAFNAHVDNAKINLVRLCGENWTAETWPAQEDRVRFLKPDAEAPWMLHLYETSLGRFGSRLAINPRPQTGMFVAGPMGHADYNTAYFEKNPELYKDEAANYYFVVASGERQYSLPFNPDVPSFPHVKQCQGMTWLEYRASAPDLPITARFRFEAPFYPQDLKLSCAPYIRLRIVIENPTQRKVQARVIVGKEVRPKEEVASARLSDWQGLLFRAPVFGIPTNWYWLAPARWENGTISSSIDISGISRLADSVALQSDREGRTVLPVLWRRPLAGLEANVTIDPFASVEVPLLWVAWVDSPVLEALGKKYRFIYTELFDGPDEIVLFAQQSSREIERRTQLFESTVTDATLPQSLKDFLAFAFQSWVMNTWYLIADDRQEWFSVWEGCCKFHSTVDVEYNVAPLYFQYWPQLMRLTLMEWAGRIERGVLPHDMGMGLKANGMEYSHQMEVEENTNFVLLLHQYWKYTGDASTVNALMDKVAELLQFVIEADTDQDGFVERGTANTIDQGSPAVQSAPKQVYLAVRSLAAFRAAADMALVTGHQDMAAVWRERAALIARTLDEQGWRDDHYIVHLKPAPVNAMLGTQAVAEAGMPRTSDTFGQPYAYAQDRALQGDTFGTHLGSTPTTAGFGGVHETDASPNAWQAYATTPEPPKGWDSYSLYTANGLLYPLRAGFKLPEVNLDRIRIDLGRAAAQTLGLYGSPHTSHEQNMWVSQNIWRDAVAAYFGIDMIDNIERYWALQLHINRTKRGCFTDVYNYGSGTISLDYYPRGVAAFALVQALGGIQLDVPAGRVSVMAVRSPLRLPLTALADWNAEEIPWLILERAGAETRARIEGSARLPVRLETRLFGEPW
jgi:hypothetical protein